MSDYFDNLVVRSFRPVLPVHPLEAPPLALSPEVPNPLKHPTPAEFEDPFAKAIDFDSLADEPEQPSVFLKPSTDDDTRLRPPAANDREPPEAPSFENDRRLKPQAHSVKSSTDRERVERRDQRISHPSDEALPAPATIPTSNAGPQAGKPLQPSVDQPQKSPPSAASIPSANVTRSEFRPAPVKRSAAINSAMPLSSSPQPAVRPPNKNLSASEQGGPLNSQRDVSPELTRSSALERMEVRRVTQSRDIGQPVSAPLTTLIPRPDSENLIPPTRTGRSIVRPPTSPNATDAEAPPPETSINVSIGRIEVRATLPQPARPERRNAPPVMNLDEYLRRRNGGSR